MKTPNHLELQLLALLDDGPRHGYALREELRRRSAGSFDLLPGTLHPPLRRLEAGGLVTSGWRAGPKRRRRVYRLTTEGSRQLELRLRDWVEFIGAVTDVIGGG